MGDWFIRVFGEKWVFWNFARDPSVWDAAPIRAHVFLGLGDVSGSGGIWEKLGLG